MQEVQIRLSSARDVQRFVHALAPLPGDFELVSGDFVLDARSLMGIFGMDLSKPLCLRVYQDDPKTMSALKSYRTDMEGTCHEQ